MADLLSLEELAALPEDEMGRGPCVYFLWRGQELLYIGATTQRGIRIPRHWREQRYGYSSSGIGATIPFDRVTFLNCQREALWDLEHAYQTRYEAPYNVYGPQARKSTVDR